MQSSKKNMMRSRGMIKGMSLNEMENSASNFGFHH